MHFFKRLISNTDFAHYLTGLFWSTEEQWSSLCEKSVRPGNSRDYHIGGPCNRQKRCHREETDSNR